MFILTFPCTLERDCKLGAYGFECIHKLLLAEWLSTRLGKRDWPPAMDPHALQPWTKDNFFRCLVPVTAIVAYSQQWKVVLVQHSRHQGHLHIQSLEPSKPPQHSKDVLELLLNVTLASFDHLLCVNVAQFVASGVGFDRRMNLLTHYLCHNQFLLPNPHNAQMQQELLQIWASMRQKPEHFLFITNDAVMLQSQIQNP